MLTMEQILDPTENEFHLESCSLEIGPMGGLTVNIDRIRRNGQVKTWKTRPDEWDLPVKYGFKSCFHITHLDTDRYHTSSSCPFRQIPKLGRSRPLAILPDGTRDLITKVVYSNEQAWVKLLYSGILYPTSMIKSKWLSALVNKDIK